MVRGKKYDAHYDVTFGSLIMCPTTDKFSILLDKVKR